MPAAALVALSALYFVLSLWVIAVIFGPPYDVAPMLPLVAACIMMAWTGLRARRRYRRLHGMDAA